MTYQFYNLNPANNLVIDCTVRAIALLTKRDWDTVYVGLSLQGFEMKDMPNSNGVWSAYLRKLGYTREVIPNTCPDCYSIREFAIDHPNGEFLLGTGTHVVTIINGVYYDTWDSGDEVPIYYWRKGYENNAIQ